MPMEGVTACAASPSSARRPPSKSNRAPSGGSSHEEWCVRVHFAAAASMAARLPSAAAMGPKSLSMRSASAVDHSVPSAAPSREDWRWSPDSRNHPLTLSSSLPLPPTLSATSCPSGGASQGWDSRAASWTTSDTDAGHAPPSGSGSASAISGETSAATLGPRVLPYMTCMRSRA